MVINGYKHISGVIDEAKKKMVDIRSGKFKPLFTSSKKETDKIGGFYPSDQVVIAARPGGGKCLGEGTEVVMFDGKLKKVEDLVVGDLLMGVDSKPRVVLELYNGEDDLYKVNQNKGISYIVNKEHILSLKTSGNYNNYELDSIINIPVKEYITKNSKFKNRLKGYKPKEGIEFEEKPYSLEPYYLGLWLGDGNSTKSTIYSMDKEIVDYLNNYAKLLGLDLKEELLNKGNNKAKGYSFSKNSSINSGISIYRELRLLNLLNNKHIPPNYLFTSKRIRLQVLAGLLDSDGHLEKGKAMYEITQKNYRLIENIKYLCDSLSFRCSINNKIVNGVTYYRAIITGNNLEAIPTLLPRKKVIKYVESRIDKTKTGISLTYKGIGRYFGFKLDGDSLFLLKDFTVSHNTARLIQLLTDFCDQSINPFYNNKLMILYDSWEMAAWRNILRMISRREGVEAKVLLDHAQKLQEETFARFLAVTEAFKDFPVFISSQPTTVEQWKENRKQIQGKYPDKYIVNLFDHTRLILKNDENKEEEKLTSLMTAGIELKNNFNMINIFLSQMNRNIETGVNREKIGSNVPVSSDLFGGDSVFQCADIVLALHRPGMYGLTDFEGIPTGIDKSDPHQPDNLMIEVVLKQREGWTGNLYMKHNLAHNKIEDYDVSAMITQSKDQKQLNSNW